MYLFDKTCRCAWLRLVICVMLGVLQASAFDFRFDDSYRYFAGLISFISLSAFLAIAINTAGYVISTSVYQLKIKAKSVFFLGYAYGLGLFGYGINWIYISLHDFGGSSLVFAIAANVGVVCYLALYWGFAAYLIVKIGNTNKQRLLAAPAVIVLLEWVRSVFLIGFPWLSLGYAQIDNKLARFSSLGGVWLVSFIVCALSSLLLLIFISKQAKYTKIIYIVIFGFLFGFLYKFQLFSDFTKVISAKPVKIALLQGNIGIITKFESEQMQASVDSYLRLSDSLLTGKDKPDILVWPETAIPFFDYESTKLIKDIADYQKQYHFDLITGIPIYTEKDEHVYNGIIHLKQNDININHYYKHHLLPFGEYLPYRNIFNFFKDYVTIPMSDFNRGKVVQPPFVSNGLRFANSICFEIVFGNEIAQNAKNADVLLNISNDGWFGHSKAQEQHLNIARMRAVENQKMLVRDTNDGITAIIDSNGQILNTMPSFKVGAVTGNVVGKTGMTPYSKNGDLPVVIAFSLMVVCSLLFKLITRRRI